MKYYFSTLLTCLTLACGSLTASNNFADTTRAYAFPHVSTTPKGTIGMSWTETDNDGVNYFYWAESTDQGTSFGEKRLIHQAKGIANSRLMRAKVLYKKNGSLVAIFGLRAAAPVQVAPAPTSDAHAHHHNHDSAATPKKAEGEAPRKGRSGRPSDLQINYAVSNDNGKSWSRPKPIHKDLTPNIIRGFYDATLMSNDEIAVAFLKDTGRPHERDLRFVTSVKGVFGEERVIDPFVCDCCNVNLLTDEKGNLNIYYRANINNIRDIAVLSSSNNGKTFSKTRTILDDKWEIKGCPHSGPVSVASASANVVGWFSGTPDAPGIRIATQEGKKLTTLDANAANPWLAGNKNGVWVMWEHKVQESEAKTTSNIVYKKISTALNSSTETAASIGEGANFSGVAVDGALVVAYEVKGNNNKATLKWSKVKI
jgi:hypothetical protein